MKRFVCLGCQTQFEINDQSKSNACPTCGKKVSSDFEVFRVLKHTSFSFALIAVLMFIPILAARQVSGGYYEIPGSKQGRHLVSENGLMAWKITNLVAAIFFVGLGLWFSKKQSEKQPADATYISIK